MAKTIPTTEMPDDLVIGDFWTWYMPASTEFPAASWTLSFGFAGPATLASGTGWTITAQSDGTWLVQVAKATTAGYTAGRYRWSAVVTGGSSERYQIAAGWVVIQPNIPVLTGDQRTHAQKMLAYIESALEARANGDIFAESVSIGGRSISKMTTAELRRLRGQYAAEVYREQNQASAGVQSVGVTFLPPTT